MGYVSRLDELGRIIGSASAVLIKDEPEARRGIDGERHIAGDRDHGVILVIGHGLRLGTAAFEFHSDRL